MKKVLLIILCLICLLSGCAKEPKPQEKPKTPITINLPKDDKVNGYRTDDYSSPDYIPQDDVSVSTQNNTVSYCGNKNSKIFHKSNCDSVKNTKESNKVYFKTKEEYTQKGYTPCQKCKP